MESKSKLEFDYSDNPALAALFATKKPGDSVTLEIEFLVNELDDKKASGSIKSVCDCSEGEEGMEEDEVSPTDQTPVMIVLRSKKE